MCPLPIMNFLETAWTSADNFGKFVDMPSKLDLCRVTEGKNMRKTITQRQSGLSRAIRLCI